MFVVDIVKDGKKIKTKHKNILNNYIFTQLLWIQSNANIANKKCECTY